MKCEANRGRGWLAIHFSGGKLKLFSGFDRAVAKIKSRDRRVLSNHPNRLHLTGNPDVDLHGHRRFRARRLGFRWIQRINLPKQPRLNDLRSTR